MLGAETREMRCPTLAELPPPPPGRAGWPWTEEVSSLPDTMPDGSPWPRVSIITPSYNQAPFLEETIRSVLLQGYPDLEYLIIDGGSTDGSVKIIRKYEPWLAYWASEKDRGQSHAINKGWARATGETVAWLNSDDYYQPGIMGAPVLELAMHPEAVLVYGDCRLVTDMSEYMRTWKAGVCSPRSLLLDDNQIPQQSTFIRASALSASGGVNERLHYTMDHELWVRLGVLGEMRYVPGTIGNFRYHSTSKSVAQGYLFFLETIEWLRSWDALGEVLTEDERQELFRRLHVKAALEYVFAGRPGDAAKHFALACAGSAWPYGSREALATRILETWSLSAEAMADSWQRIELLREALVKALPGPSALSLWRCIAARYHMRLLFASVAEQTSGHVRRHWLAGIWYDPRWLSNAGVWSRAMEAFLGARLASRIRSFWRGRLHVGILPASSRSGETRT